MRALQSDLHLAVTCRQPIIHRIIQTHEDGDANANGKSVKHARKDNLI